jgi:hypothetical protein
MELVKNLIHENIDRYNHLDYYFRIIDSIEKNEISNPDISIESCKSLIEGISKFILQYLDEANDKNKIEKMDFPEVFKKSITELSNYKEIEPTLISRIGGFIKRLAEIRNARADISHGKLAPKDEESSARLSKLVKHTTEGLVFYLLDNFLSLDLSYKEDVKYEDNKIFNQVIDEENSMPSYLSYSKALFEQDNVAYIDRLDEYNLESEEAE